MIYEEKQALHYQVIANSAKTIEKIAKELASLYGASHLDNKKINLRESHLKKRIKALYEQNFMR